MDKEKLLQIMNKHFGVKIRRFHEKGHTEGYATDENINSAITDILELEGKEIAVCSYNPCLTGNDENR